MNEKQYLRANKRVFLAVTIIFAYITLTMLAALAASHGDHFVRIMIQCLVSVGVIIISDCRTAPLKSNILRTAHCTCDPKRIRFQRICNLGIRTA